MLKENLFLTDWIPPFQNWGMETHAEAYIKYQWDKIIPYSFKILEPSINVQKIISKYNLSNINFTLPFDSVKNPKILNNIIWKHFPEFVFFNSLFWIEIINQIKEVNTDIKLILRSGGNDISQSNIQHTSTLKENRNFIVNTINNSIDLLIVNSQFTFDKFLEYWISKDKMKVIIGWVDTKKFSPIKQEEKNLIREKLGIPDNQNIGISVSRLVEFKNIPAVLEVAKNIVSTPNNIFILVGWGPLLDHAKKYIKKYKLSNKILIIWDVPLQDISQYYSVADYFLQMSTYSKTYVPSTETGWEYYFHTEAMGRSAIEAMASGLPVIATNVWWVSEVIKDWWILIPDNDISAAVNSILEINTNTSLKKLLSERARKIASTEYSWNNVFNSYQF